MHKTGIYEISNLVNGKRYIGSAVSFAARWLKHTSQLSRGCHHSRILQNAWDKYGAGSFEFRCVLVCDRENLMLYEQTVIDAFQPEYNVCKKAFSCLGVKRTKDSIEKMISARIAVGGWSPSAETRALISASLKGRPGRRKTPEQREAMSLAKRGVVTDHLRELAKKKLGVPRTQDVRAKLSKAIASLSDEQVREIRLRCANGEKQSDVGAQFGIRQPSVSEIVRRISYKWVD